MPFVSSGFGDGTFPVFALTENARSVGFEIEFIPAGQPYPFGKQEALADPPAEPEKGDTLRDLLASVLQESFGTNSGTPLAAKGDLKGAVQAVADDLRAQAAAATFEWGNRLRRLRATAPPLTIRLIPTKDTAWLVDDASGKLNVTALEQSGFRLAGVFGIEGQPGITVAGFAQPRGTVHATLARAGAHVFLGLVRRRSDDTFVEFNNLPNHAQAPAPDWVSRHSQPGANAAALLAQSLADPTPSVWLPATTRNYSALTEHDFVRHHAWLAEHGGRPAPLLRERLKAAGRLPAGPAGTEAVAMARADEAEQALWNWLKLSEDLPFNLDAVAGTLVVVHDDLSPTLLATTYWWATADYSAREAEFRARPARRTFAAILKRRQSNLAKALAKETPLAADFYLPRPGGGPAAVPGPLTPN